MNDRPHPPLHGIWLDIIRHLAVHGPTQRTTLRHVALISNHSWKSHSRLLKLRGLINVHAEGLVWLTERGRQALEISQ